MQILQMRSHPIRWHLGPALGARLAIRAFPLFVGWSISSPIPGPAPGSAACEPHPGATTAEYLTGVACPPLGFAEAAGYDPILIETVAGWRYVRPVWTGADCSGPLADTGPFWNFTTECGMHDYGYDLVRFGVGKRTEVDDLLYGDMLRSCGERGHGAIEGCKALAEWAHAVLEVGHLAGMEPQLGDFA